MEKYSAYRDAGTGIQPFLKPVPATASTLLATALVPLGLLIGVIRVTLVLLVAILYFLSVEVVLKVLSPIAPLKKFFAWVLTAILTRFVLLLLGLWWIPTIHVTRKRGRGAPLILPWAPKAGDVIVSNWASWVEVLWLAFRFNPIFVLPIPAPVEKCPLPIGAPASNSPRRRTGTGSAAIASPASRPPSVRIPILGFNTVSLLDTIRFTGAVPPFGGLVGDARTLDSIRESATRPIVVFPECTTSNGRALLRFADVFSNTPVPVKGFNIFVMCVRYDPPTLYTPTLTCSIPSFSSLNPLPHVFRVAMSLSPSLTRTLSIRLLNPAESPSSDSFLVSDVLAGGEYKDELTEVCAVLIAQLGKMKITGQQWEDKMAFLDFYRRKNKQ